jgi:hypothetical protein
MTANNAVTGLQSDLSRNKKKILLYCYCTQTVIYPLFYKMGNRRSILMSIADFLVLTPGSGSDEFFRNVGTYPQCEIQLFTPVWIKEFFWVLTPYGPVFRCQLSGETCCLSVP